MTLVEIILGLALVITCAGMMGIFMLPRRKRAPRALRPLPAFDRLRRAVGLAVEDGKRLHVSLGNASILDPDNASALAGLGVLERLAQVSVMSDRPPLATSGNGSLSILSQDILRYTSRNSDSTDQYDPDRGILAGVTPLSYTAGVIPMASAKNVSANILVGHYGGEIALICAASEAKGNFVLAASDSLPAQAVLYATSDEPLIGEELFALTAYLNSGPAHHASLRVQDILRWVLILGILAGAVLKFLGV